MKKSQKSTPRKVAAPFTRDLPPEYMGLIGSVMVNWAFFEMRLQELVFRALNVTDKQGRLAVKTLRAKEMAVLAVELAELRGIAFPAQVSPAAIQLLESRRNLLAHGIWMKFEGGYALRDLTGVVSIGGKKVKKKIQPSGIPITLDALQNLDEQIQLAISDTEAATLAMQERLSASPGILRKDGAEVQAWAI